MNKNSRLLMIIASLLLLLLFLLPLWKITLGAPQYPDGLRMYLNIDGISDRGTGDIGNINIMNHYVGMKDINEEDFKEFTYIPYIMISLVLLGLISAFVKTRKLILIWLILFVILGILGLYDFYRWEYEYGHNLNPMAAIKVPGAYYQPPMFGSKTILNFDASAYPQLGAYLIGVSMFLASLAWWKAK